MHARWWSRIRRWAHTGWRIVAVRARRGTVVVVRHACLLWMTLIAKRCQELAMLYRWSIRPSIYAFEVFVAALHSGLDIQPWTEG